MAATLLSGLLGVGVLAVVLLAIEGFRWAARRVAGWYAIRSATRPPVSVPPAVAERRG